MTKKKIGLLIMAYGTPYKEEDIEPYYTHIRRGRKPSAEALQDLKERYDAIGGISPFAKITEKQAQAICNKLNDMQAQYKFEVFIGLKHIHPFIEDAVTSMQESGIEEAVSLVLAPHYSTMSIKDYNERAKEKADKYGIKLHSINHWYDAARFIKFWAEEIQKVYDEIPQSEHEETMLIVSAHSLPERILQENDPYPKQLEETAQLIADKAGIPHYTVGWQSEGNTAEPWLGPDVQDLTRELYGQHPYKNFVYAPVGFVSDHLEVLYDNDYECKLVCDEIGAKYYRPNMPNTDERFIAALAEIVLQRLK